MASIRKQHNFILCMPDKDKDKTKKTKKKKIVIVRETSGKPYQSRIPGYTKK